MNKQFLSLLLLVSFGSTLVNAAPTSRVIEEGFRSNNVPFYDPSRVKAASKLKDQIRLETEKAAFRHKVVKSSVALGLGAGVGYATYKYLGNAESKTNKTIIAATTAATTAGTYYGYDKVLQFSQKAISAVSNSIFPPVPTETTLERFGAWFSGVPSATTQKAIANAVFKRNTLIAAGCAVAVGLGYGLYKLGSSYAMGNQPQINIDREIAQSEALLSCVPLLEAQVNNKATNAVRAQITAYRQATGKDLVEEIRKQKAELVKAKSVSTSVQA